MKSDRQRLAVVCVLGLASSVSAFTSINPSGLGAVHKMPQSPSISTTRHNALPGDHQIYTDLLNQVSHSSQLLADAATAAAGETKELGWWGQYINLFKITLSAVHGAVDGPLRSIGFDQTWGVSIALFTISIRSLLIPLSIQQSQSAEYMKALKPYTKEIKEKFKDNQDAQNRALGKLYEDADQNPLSGCLVSLAQLPIFLGLYRGVRLLAQDGQLNEGFLWIPSLEGPVSPPNYNGLDWLTSGWNTIDGTPVPPLGWEATVAFLIMPVILVVLQSFTMSTLQPPVDEDATEEERQQMESTQGVLKFLPLLIGFFSLQVPAGLTIYWLSSNFFTLTQSLAVKAYFSANPPEIELPDYWEDMNNGKAFEEMTPDERRQATEAGLRVGPSMDDLVNQAKFHVYIERQPFRETTDSWKRAQESDIKIPAAFEEWVNSSAPKAEAELTEIIDADLKNGKVAEGQPQAEKEPVA